jgi:hypothetical protein
VSNPKLFRICVAFGVIGLVAMLPFDYWYTRAIGMIGLAGFVVSGLFLIADPAYLSRDSREEDRPIDEAVQQLAKPPHQPGHHGQG